MSDEMISVPRYKLKTLIAQCLDEAGGNPDLILEELRALLAKPAKPTKSECPHCLGDSMFGCAECEPEDLGQHQGEPARWIFIGDDRREHLSFSKQTPNSVPLYTRPAEQTAPVAVVLPRRRIIRAENPAARISHSQGWNACLDEVARLNPPQQ